MTSRKRNDAIPLLLIVVGVAGMAVWRTLSGLDLSSKVPEAKGVAQLLGMATLSGVLCLAIARTIATRSSLRSRVRLTVIPADEFDPPVEAVLRFAAQLARVKRTVRGPLERRASAVRVCLASDAAGRLVYALEMPAQAESLVRASLRTYEGLEVHGDDLFAEPSRSRPSHTARAELVLARRSVEPLARRQLEPDPLQPFASAMSALQPAEGDRAEVYIDLLPTSGGERRRLQRRLYGQAARRDPTESARGLDRLLDGDRRRALPVDLAKRRAEAAALDAKLKDAGALFRAQVLVRCQAAHPARAKTALRSLLAAFEQFADRNWLRVVGLLIPGVAFAGSDLPLRRRWFDRRAATGLFRPARRSVVTAREVAAFLKPPTRHCSAQNVLRAGVLVGPPPDLPGFDPERPRRDVIPLGHVASDSGSRLVGVRTADTFFSYCAGRSRYGKTELAMAQFLHVVKAGHGALFLDPHEDAIVNLKRHLVAPGLRERVIELNLASSVARERQPAWNLFELGAVNAGEAEARVEAIVDAFASALRWHEHNSRAINLTTQAAHALAAVARVLPAPLAPTIFQLPTLLSDEEWRAAALPFLPSASRRFWHDRFPRLADEAITPVTNLIDRLRSSTPITALLGQSESTYRIRQAMDRGLIVLACPGSGGTRDRLIANLIVFDLLHSAIGRARVPSNRRRPFYCFLDEVQTYDGASSGNLAALLEQTAKYGIRAFFLNQNPERLTPATLNALTTNRSHLLTTALNARAAQLIAREWAGAVDPGGITRLPRYRFVGQVTDGGEQSRPFLLRGLSVKELHGDGHADQVPVLEQHIDRTAGRRTVKDALDHLETLDDRILQHLRRHRGNGARGGAPLRASGLEIDAHHDNGT